MKHQPVLLLPGVEILYEKSGRLLQGNTLIGHFSPVEAGMFTILFINPYQVVAHDTLFYMSFPDDVDASKAEKYNYVHTNMKRVHDRFVGIHPALSVIESIYGQGYRYVPHASVAVEIPERSVGIRSSG